MTVVAMYADDPERGARPIREYPDWAGPLPAAGERLEFSPTGPLGTRVGGLMMWSVVQVTRHLEPRGAEYGPHVAVRVDLVEVGS